MNLQRENTINSLKNHKIENHFGKKIQQIDGKKFLTLQVNNEQFYGSRKFQSSVEYAVECRTY